MPPRPEDFVGYDEHDTSVADIHPLDDWVRLEQTKMLASLVQARIRAGLSGKDLAELLGSHVVNPIESLNPDQVRLSIIRRYAAAVGAVVSHHVLADPEAAGD